MRGFTLFERYHRGPGTTREALDADGWLHMELKPGTSATEEELIDYCRGKIASFKVPRYVRFVEE